MFSDQFTDNVLLSLEGLQILSPKSIPDATDIQELMKKGFVKNKTCTNVKL